jgi:hypothetical protein
MMTAILLILISITLLVSIFGVLVASMTQQTLSKNYTVALDELGKLRIALSNESAMNMTNIQTLVQSRMAQNTLIEQVRVMERGRHEDQEMLNKSIERAERFKRVLESVLQSQGCSNESIAMVISRTEADLD